jgi:restriction system protein
MVQRRRRSGFQGVLDLAGGLPWWLYVVMALASFAVLRALGSVLQYLLPWVFAAGAAMSIAGRRSRREWQQQVSELSGAAVIDGMKWQEFEMLVAEGFRRRGYMVTESGHGAKDGAAVDMALNRGRELFLVQCKQWRAFNVGIAPVRELYDAMTERDAAGGFIVTSGVFTAEAASYAQGRNIRLIDGLKLQDLVHSADEKTIPVVRRRSGPPTRP